MARPVAHGQALDRVTLLCGSGSDVRSLRLGVLAEIRKAVGFDAYAWLLTDPETTVGIAPLADVPRLSELPRLIRLKYLTNVNRWTTLDGVGIARLPEATRFARADAGDWAAFLAGCGIGEVASVVFRDTYGCWGWLDLWRARTRGPFTHREIALLTDIVRPVTSALRGSVARTFVVRPTGHGRPPGPVVLLLTPTLDVLTLTAQAHEYLRILVPPPSDRPPIPANAYNVAAQLLAVEAGVDHHPALARVHLADGLWVTMRAASLEGESTAQRNIAVTIEESSPSERVAVFARSFGLSPRETELLRHLATGSDTRDVAQRMFLSEHTVQDYLKGIFEKTSARSRRTVVSRALGN